MTITITIQTVDNSTTRRTFKALPSARKFAAFRMGATPTIGSDYAVDDFGVATLRVTGASLADIFPATVAPVSAPGRCTGDPAILQFGGDCNCRTCVAAEDAYYAQREKDDFERFAAAYTAAPQVDLQLALIGREEG